MYEIKYRRLSEMAKDQTRNQHYIPRFYLKEFATNDTYGKKGKEQVYIYDKKSEKSEPRNIKKIAKENYLYSPKDSNGNRSMYMEKRLGDMENLISLIWNDFSNDFIDLENYNTKKVMAMFISSLILRHPDNLEKNENSRNFLINDIIKHNHLNNKKVAFIVNGEEHPFDISELTKKATEYEKSMFFVENIDYFMNEFSEIFMKKKWSIIISEEKKFITSDNPIIIDNNLTNIFGLNTQGTIILFPISPKRLLQLEDYTDDNEKEEVSYHPINEDHHSLYNHIIWNSSDNHILANKNFEDILNEIYNYIEKNKENR